MMQWIRAALIVVWMPFIGSGCAQYEYRVSPERYTAVERGKRLELALVGVRDTQGPWSARHDQLVVPCWSKELGDLRDMPCWPERRGDVSLDLLATIYHRMRPYRSKVILLCDASFVHREVGALQEAWVVGTYPLVVAYRESHADFDDLGSRAFATSQLAHADWRQRRASLVEPGELSEEVNALLVDYGPPRQRADLDVPTSNARLLLFRTPRSLLHFMEAMAQPDGIEQLANSADRVVELKPG